MNSLSSRTPLAALLLLGSVSMLGACANLSQRPYDNRRYDDRPYYDDDYYRRREEERLREERRELRRERERYERERAEDERRRLEEERRELDRQRNDPRPRPPVERCPSGFAPSEEKCTQDERNNGCQDMRLPGGLGCVKRAPERRRDKPERRPRGERCPSGFTPSEEKCTQKERKNGCKDMRLPDGLGCVKSEFR